MSDPHPQWQVTSVPDLLADVADLLGQHPQRSAVIVGFHDQHLDLIARLDLPAAECPVTGPASDTAAAAQILHDIAVQCNGRGSIDLVVLGYGDPAPVTALFDLATAVFTVHGLTVLQLIRIAAGRYFQHQPGQPADTDGTPFTLPARPATTAADNPPQDPHRDPDDMAPVTGAAAAAMRAAHHRALARLNAALLRSQSPRRPGPYDVGAHDAAAAVGDALLRLAYAAVDTAVRTCHTGGALGDDDAAELIVLLRSDVVLDYAYAQTDSDDGRHLHLWLDLTRRAMPGFAAAPACLAGYLAWRAHQPALARHCTDRALRDDPGNPFAVLIQALLDEHVPPHLAQIVTQRIAARRRADGTDR